MTRQFGSDNRTFVYVRDANLWSPQRLADLEQLHYALVRLDFVQRVDDLFTLRSVRGHAGRLDVRPLMPGHHGSRRRRTWHGMQPCTIL